MRVFFEVGRVTVRVYTLNRKRIKTCIIGRWGFAVRIEILTGILVFKGNFFYVSLETQGNIIGTLIDSFVS